MIELPEKTTIEIPPAFYRDADPPLPPPSDPHRREWDGWQDWEDDDREPVPRWMCYGLPAMLIIAAAFHAALIYIVLTVKL
ncbi:MAG TPA: hypothetical protein VFE42_00480 [Chloroflexota bacterium]|nr:hypothetical protein [Chloroflexota bacterium]